MSETKFNLIVGAILLVLVLGIAFGIRAFNSAMESKTYNKLTGAQTTWWDAMWVELRVQEAPVKEKGK